MEAEELEWINNYYGLSISIGQDLLHGNRKGTVVEDQGNYIGVIFHDDEKRGVNTCHPTSGITYLESKTDLKKLRPKNWRSKQRYRDYLEVSDCYDSFKHYLSCNQSNKNY